MDQEKIGILFKERREAKNITQQELADILNVTDRAISNWEHGRRLPDYSLLAKLCDILSISLEEVFLMGKKKEKDKTQATKETNELIDYYLSTHSTKELTGLNEKYQLDDFIWGSCNEHVGESLCKTFDDIEKGYNTFYVYGVKGTGKTHFIQALGNGFIRWNDDKVLYMTGIQFVDECYNISQRHEKIQDFVNKYKDIDTLIIDDIQYIKGDKAIIELFHMMDYLLDHDRFIILSGDKPYNELNLDIQIKDRIKKIHQAELYPLDWYTRRAILKNLIKGFPKVKIKSSVIDYIATTTMGKDANILNDSISQLIAYALISDVRIITLDDAKKALKDLINEVDSELDKDYDFDYDSFWRLSFDNKSEEYHNNTAEAMRDLGERLLIFKDKSDDKFEYYIDTVYHSLHKKLIDKNYWYEFVIVQKGKQYKKRCLKLFYIDESNLVKIKNFKKVLEFVNNSLENVKKRDDELEIDIDYLTKED